MFVVAILTRASARLVGDGDDSALLLDRWFWCSSSSVLVRLVDIVSPLLPVVVVVGGVAKDADILVVEEAVGR